LFAVPKLCINTYCILYKKALETKINERLPILDVNCIASVSYLGVPQTISKRLYLAYEPQAEYHTVFTLLKSVNIISSQMRSTEIQLTSRTKVL
jgi:hypothetical protein